MYFFTIYLRECSKELMRVVRFVQIKNLFFSASELEYISFFYASHFANNSFPFLISVMELKRVWTQSFFETFGKWLFFKKIKPLPLLRFYLLETLFKFILTFYILISTDSPKSTTMLLRKTSKFLFDVVIDFILFFRHMV